MTYWVCPELPSAAVRSSQATLAAVDNSAPLATRPESTYKAGKVVQTSGATSHFASRQISAISLNMNRIAILAVLSAVSAAISADDRTPRIVHAFADPSCGEWVRSRQAQDQSAQWQYRSWFRGFVSGFNEATPQRQVSRFPNDDTVALYVDKFCRENPLLDFPFAATKLVRELSDVQAAPSR